MASSDRDQRLAAKLRENLKRRKAQAKARGRVEKTPDADGPARAEGPDAPREKG